MISAHLQLPDVLATMKSRFNALVGSKLTCEKAKDSLVQNAALSQLDKYGAFDEGSDLLPIVIAYSSCNKYELMQKEAELVSLIEKAKAQISSENPDLDESLALIKAVHQDKEVYLRVRNTVHEVALTKAFHGSSSDMLVMTKVKGFDINKRGEDGETLLTLAAQAGQLDAVNALLNLDGIDVNQTNTDKEDTPLIKAARAGHLSVVEALLDCKSTNKHCKNKFEVTPLIVAAQYGYLEIVKALLKAGVDVNAIDDEKASALIIAAQHGELEAVKELIQAGALVNAADKDGDSALILASANGHIAVVKELLKTEGIQINHQGWGGYTALQGAARYGKLDVVKELLKANDIDLSIKDTNQQSPLHIASKYGQLDVVKELLKVKGFDLNALSDKKVTPLDIAAALGHKDIVVELLKAGASPNLSEERRFSPLYLATSRGFLDIVKELLKIEGIDIDCPDQKEGSTALIEAARAGHKDIVLELINAGANLSAKDKDDSSVLQVAIANGYLDVVKELLKLKKFDINEVNGKKLTSLDLAAICGHKDIVVELLKAGAHPNDSAKNGFSPLYLAAAKGYLDIVKELLKVEGIDVNFPDNDENNTALLVAAGLGHKDIVVDLINAGANVNIGNKNGVSPLQFAAAKGHLDVVNELLEVKGIDLNAVDARGETALMEAIRHGHLDVVKALLSKRSINVKLVDQAKQSPLMVAALQGNIDIFNEVLKRSKALVNNTDIHGNTALLKACAKGHLEIAKALLDIRTINATCTNKDGYGALILAVQSGNLELMDALIKNKKVDVNQANNEGNTPLIIAAKKGNLNTVRLLLNRPEIDIFKVNKASKTALSAAIEANHLDIVKEIVEYLKRTPEKHKDSVEIALILASNLGRAQVVEYLVNEPGIDINRIQSDGNTALKSAIKQGHIEVVRILCSQISIDVNAVTSTNNHTPICNAVIFNKFEIFKILLAHEKIDLNPPYIKGCSLLILAVAACRSKFVRELANKPGLDIAARFLSNGYDALMCAIEKMDIEVLQELLKFDGIDVNTVDNKGISTFAKAASQSSTEMLCTLLSSGKVDFETIKENDSYLDASNQLIRDFRNTFEKVYLEKDIRDLSIEEYKELIDLNKGNHVMLYLLSKLNIKAAYIVARDYGNQYLSALVNNLVDLKASQDADTMPRPDDSVDISKLMHLTKKYRTPDNVNEGVAHLVINIRNRRVIPGLPSKETDPEKFELAYSKIERELKVIVTAAIELDDKVQKSSKEEEKDPREKLMSILSRLGEIGPFCGTRYMQEMPMIYHGEVALMQELDCVQKWSSVALQVPELASKELAIRSHMGDVLYPLKIAALKEVYEKTKPPEARYHNVHYLSGFWKMTREDFSLKDDVDTDPLAKTYRQSLVRLKAQFKKELSSEATLDEAMRHIKVTGGDSNPYLGYISELAGESRVGLPLDQVMQEVYDFDDYSIPTGIKRPFIGMMFQDLGLLH